MQILNYKNDYPMIDWRATRNAMKDNGVKLSRLATELEVNYGSLNVIMAGRHKVENPEASALIRTIMDGLAARGFLVLKTEPRTGTEG